jgi:hypothetical protein
LKRVDLPTLGRPTSTMVGFTLEFCSAKRLVGQAAAVSIF